MSNNKNTLINKYFKLYLSLFTLIIGILFVWHTCDIYFAGKDSGEQMYTRAIINSHLLTILVPIILYVVSIIAGIVLHFVFPEDKKRLVPKKEFKEIYNLYINKFDLNSIEDKNVLPLLNKEKTKRLVALIIEIVVCLFCLTMVLCFLFNLSFYSSDGNLIKEMINIVAHILPFVVLAYGISLAYIYFVESSYKRSIEAIKSSKLQKKDINKSNSNKILDFFQKYGVLVSRCLVGTLSILFIILGILNGGHIDVLNKAIKICTECIGLG